MLRLVPDRAGSTKMQQNHPVRYPGLQRLPRNSNKLDIERLSINARVNFVEWRPTDTAVAILQEIENSLRAALHEMSMLPGARGGQKPIKGLLINNWLIMSALER